tara:strand:+ start:178 stop:513 length:336 start_codon:yes stop_codon:yes gene_type:complete
MALNFQNIKGDTFNEVAFELLLNAEPYSLVDAVIKMQLKKEYCGIPFLSLTSVAAAGITITDASNGLFKINEQIINIEPFNYIYDIEIEFSDGTVKTYISGNFLIKSDVTR